VFNKGALDTCMEELEQIKKGLKQKNNRGEYFRVSEKYRNLQKHKKNMNQAKNDKKNYDFKEIEHHSDLLKKKNEFFNNYLNNGK
jgi:small-conductance mechanosensitive channel